MSTNLYSEKAYKLVKKNTKYNNEGKAVISSDDEWINETEWDEIFEEVKSEKLINK